MRMDLKSYFENEKKKISALTPGQKIFYVIEYYWLWIGAVFFALFFAGYLIHNMFFRIHENWFYILFTNIMPEESVIREIQEDYAAYAGYDLSEKNVVIGASSYFDASVSGGTNNTYYQVFTAAVEAGDLDAVIMEEDNLKAVGASGILLDLSSGEYADLFAPYEDRFVYTVPYDESYSTSPVPVGIDISSSLLSEKYHLYEEGCVLGAGNHMGHPEALKAFLEFIGIEGEGDQP